MKIVLLDAKTLANNSLLPLTLLGELVTYQNTTHEQIITRCIDADVIVSNKVVINSKVLASLPKLKLICVAATGTNNIDLRAAKKQGIAVCNVAGYSTSAVVQHTFTLLGNLMGNMHRYIADCKNGQWQSSDIFCRLDYPIKEIAAKNFTIIGYGTLGKAIANVAQAFGAHVIIAERPNARSIRAGRVAFKDAIKSADIISIHCPLNDETKDLFNASVLAQLKPSAVLINTARGGIVNELALVSALNEQQLAGAALDVLSIEPAQKNNPLFEYSGHNLLLTPHNAWAAEESIDRLIHSLANNIKCFLNGEHINRVV
ncbi:D-2-hydroxyacid dehydrogenase [Pseudoalteromonas sp. MMG012]|uniref:D-2-hydroxyacid dehydrogenase n=1 Tax=Pseudoalteromonas sp. MMG012 TaxID=2822686 RepID=UPI001B39F088|nr:D-2-hydroxyacid dehydrogenase [Pseudoalteromonas sp. MMG012]MBQ4851475.1 D-2-hydroxyacid dehydrogenase [Pseudoalteromonas sp. MMG012]